MKNLTTLSVGFSALVLSIVTFAPVRAARAGESAKVSATATSARQKSEDAVKIGDLAAQNDSLDEAITDYKAAILADPSNADAHSKFIRAYEQKSYAFLTPKKIKPAKRKPTKEEQEAAQKKNLARVKKEQEKNNGILLVTYENWLKKYPKQAMFYWGKARVMQMEGKNDDAKSVLQQALAIDPSCAPALADLSDMAATAGDVPTQRADAEKALSIDPSDTSGVFLNYVLTYLSTDPPKFRQLVEDRAAKYPKDLEFLLTLAAQNTSSPPEEEAVYQKLYELYGPKSANPSDEVSYVMIEAFNLYAKSDPAKALAFAEQMQKDEAEQLAKKAAAAKPTETASKGNDKGKDAKKSADPPPKPLWESIAAFQKTIIDAQSLIAQKKYADAQALLAKNDLKPKNDYDALSGIEKTPYQLEQAEAYAGSGDNQKAYDTVKTALLPQPDASLETALDSYGAKLGKTPAQVNEDVWQSRESKAKAMTPFDLKQYVTDKDVKLADYRGQVVLVNFWFPG